jgi:hypothetical protein
MSLISDNDENYLDPEIKELVNFLQETEHQSTGFVSKQRILKNLDG